MRNGARFARWCLWSTLAVAVHTSGVQAAGDPFARCRQQFADKPQEYDSAHCFNAVAQQQRLWDEGSRVLTRLMQEHRDNFWLPLVLGHVRRDRDPDAAEALYRRAADGFRAAQHVAGEIEARSSLRNLLHQKRRIDDARAEMARVTEIGDSVDDPLLKAQVWTLQARHVHQTGGDLGLAYRLLKQAAQALFPAGPYRLKHPCLTSLGAVAFRMGRHDEAVTLYEQLDALARDNGDAQTRALAQYNLLNTLSLKEDLLPTPGAKHRLLRLAEQTLTSGLAVQNPLVIVKTRRTIAELLADEPGRRAEAVRHVDGCLDVASATRRPYDEVVCAWLKASLLQPTDADKARLAHLHALAVTEQANDPWTNAYSASRHMRFSWQTKSRADAIRDSLAAIDAMETLRSLQDDDTSSAELFSNLTLEYSWLSGRLLQDSTDEDLELAFTITERMRGRSLLEALGRPRTRPDPKLPAVVNRRTLLKDIAALQRTLMNPTLGADARQESLAKLEQLENGEREARRQMALATGERSVGSRSFAMLDSVQSALADDEALLSFQVGIWETYEGNFGGGSWLLALTRQGRTLYRIPDRAYFAPLVPVFTGLLSRRDGLERTASVRLYGDVLGGALEQLPSGVRHLIVIPDGPLQRLPFDALRATADGAPLAARYELSVAPSATLWLHWRNAARRMPGGGALALADPEIEGTGTGDASHRQALLEQGLRLGRLQYARQEGRALERHIAAVDVLTGPSASEKALKERDLRQYDLVHFAAHAVSDETRPERSAVLLSPGGKSEDGLLQAREIQDLDLTGRIVVLSACQTASGAVLNGEGVLSLARAFFEAGARAVIGTRWPIRDEDAAALFEVFYRRLGEGASLSEALAHAKREAIESGRPATAWASLELLGDGAIRPFAEDAPGARRTSWRTAALTLVFMSLVAWVAWSRATRAR